MMKLKLSINGGNIFQKQARMGGASPTLGERNAEKIIQNSLTDLCYWLHFDNHRLVSTQIKIFKPSIFKFLYSAHFRNNIDTRIRWQSKPLTMVIRIQYVGIIFDILFKKFLLSAKVGFFNSLMCLVVTCLSKTI